MHSLAHKERQFERVAGCCRRDPHKLAHDRRAQVRPRVTFDVDGLLASDESLPLVNSEGAPVLAIQLVGALGLGARVLHNFKLRRPMQVRPAAVFARHVCGISLRGVANGGGLDVEPGTGALDPRLRRRRHDAIVSMHQGVCAQSHQPAAANLHTFQTVELYGATVQFERRVVARNEATMLPVAEDARVLGHSERMHLDMDALRAVGGSSQLAH